MTTRLRVLVLGASGMLGNAMVRVLGASPGLDVVGTIRNAAAQGHPALAAQSLIAGVNVEDTDALLSLFATVRPDVVVNCVGLVKQLGEASDPLRALPLNALLPHRLAALCATRGARLIHFSTDCVFAGTRGGYREDDIADATDLYGRSKLLGEVANLPHAVTLRTSIIGRELAGHRSLIDWFLSQQDTAPGYRHAIFSGLPTCEMARIVRDLVIPNGALHGLYHVSAAPIGKFDLLTFVAAQFGKSITLIPDDRVRIDRSLDSTRFRDATGYIPPDWPTLIAAMHAFDR
jgi:dTDP-4-dehydrorhamnose reductase